MYSSPVDLVHAYGVHSAPRCKLPSASQARAYAMQEATDPCVRHGCGIIRLYLSAQLSAGAERKEVDAVESGEVLPNEGRGAVVVGQVLVAARLTWLEFGGQSKGKSLWGERLGSGPEEG